MRRRSTTRTAWLLQFTEREGRRVMRRYLHRTGGDWGPHELPCPEMESAMEFPSAQSARAHAQLHWEGFCEVTPIEVAIMTTYKVL